MSTLLIAIRRSLRERKRDIAAENAAIILSAGSNLQELQRVFADAKELDLLARLVWDRRESALRRLSDVAEFFRICSAVKQSGAYLQKLNLWLSDDSTPPVSFTYAPYLRWYKNLGDQELAALFRTKYRGWDHSSEEKFVESVSALAERCEFPQHLAKFLYEVRANRQRDYPGWLHDLKSAQVCDHFFRDALFAGSVSRKIKGPNRVFLDQFCKDASLANNVDMGRAKRFFESLDSSRGLVLCTFHSAFPQVLNGLFREFMPDHYSVGRGPSGSPGTPGVRNGQRGAAFRAVKALMQKRAVLIAPDGLFFSDAASAEIRVFGVPFQISVGAARLAYEADSDTGWCNMVREGGQFTPVYVPGPRPSRGEKFEQFRERWLLFYSAQIETVLSSDPRNLDLRSAKWSSFGVPQED